MVNLILPTRPSGLARPPFGSVNFHSPQAVYLKHWWPMDTLGRFRDVMRGNIATPSATNNAREASQLGMTWRGANGASSTYASVATRVSLDYSVGWMVSAWINFNNVTLSNNDGLVAKSGCDINWYSQQARIYMGADRVAYTTNANKQVWEHWAFQQKKPVDGTNAYFAIYLNGREVAGTFAQYLNTNFEFDYLLGSSSGGCIQARVADIRAYQGNVDPRVVWAMYDPASRWELYQIPDRMYLDVAAAAAGVPKQMDNILRSTWA